MLTNTGRPSNFLYGASLVTVDVVRRWFHYSAILILWPPTRCIICHTVAKSTMPSICKCSWNILVLFCWFQLAKCVDRRQSLWKKYLNSWFVRRVFVWRRHFLLNTSCDGVPLLCVSVLKIPQKCLYINILASKWHRICMLGLFTGNIYACVG